MNIPSCGLAVFTVALATTVFAEEGPSQEESKTAPPAKSPWAFSVTAYPTDVRDGDNYTSAIIAADRGPLHLEGRYNYESIGARSAYVGWSFSGGESLEWQITPIAGGAWGTTQSVVAGVEASLAWRSLDAYVEAEYVPTSSQKDSYMYAWSEFGFHPTAWLRLGLVGQRTRTYGGDRELQRGPLVQVKWGPLTIGGYWFNPGSSEQIFVASLGAKF